MAASGNYAYLTTYFEEPPGGGLLVVDVSNPSAPAVVGSVLAPNAPYHDVYEVAVTGHHVCFTYQDLLGSGVHVADVSNPASPEITGSLVLRDFVVRQVAAAGDHAYVAPDFPYGSVIAVDLSNYAYVTDCWSGVKVVDITNPAGPTMVGGIDTWYGTAHGVVWQTALEIDHLGFPVERSGGGGFVRVNDELVRSQEGSSYEFVDRSVIAGLSYRYRLVAIDRFGGTQTFDIGSVTVGRALPAALVLHPNHPNPFNPSTTIAFGIPEAAHVLLRIYDASGRLVRTLVDGHLARERYEVVWDGRDEDGRRLGAGIYVYRLEAGERSRTRSLVMVR